MSVGSVMDRIIKMNVWFILLQVCRSALYIGKWPNWTRNDWRNCGNLQEKFQIRAMETHHIL